MNICDTSEHGEIIHGSKKCPACDRIQELKDEISELKEQIIDYEATIKDLEKSR